MSAEGTAYIAAVGVSLLLTLGLGVQFQPDVSYYTGGVGFFPSPAGTLVGAPGVEVLAIVHALAVGAIVAGLVLLRPPFPAVLAALPVLVWLGFLGVDAIAAVLFVWGYVRGRSGALVAACAFHLAALPLVVAVWFGRRRRAAFVACVVGVAFLFSTPYRAVFLEDDPADAAQAVVLGVTVALLSLSPALWRGWSGVRPLVPLGVAVGLSAALTARWDYSQGFDYENAYWGTLRYGLPLVLLSLLTAAGVLDGRTERPTTAPGGGSMMLKRISTVFALVALGALFVVPAAFAQTVPAVPVDEYGDALLSSLATAIGTIFPYAAAITAFAIAVGMVKRWLGHRKATRV